ncbi:MAG: 3-dehydroquinate synthase [Phycisphaeraceae bacterium]
MPTIALTLPHHRYDIRIEPGALAHLGDRAKQVVPHGRAALFMDAAVAATHGQAATDSLTKAGYQVVAHQVPSGEVHKTLDTVRRLYDVLLDARLERKSPVIALGGGVVGDTVGFVAATYLRGVPFVQCPTTLLAMVDASVGGKVGVDVPQGKNLIGAFHQPSLVVIDTDTLSTLPPRELRCGLAECVKHGVIRDAALFDWIADHVDDIRRLDGDTLVELVARNVQIKANVVMADEKETGERAHLNFGHTFAHAIETTTGYGAGGSYQHGEAVALGMVAATRLAVDIRRCPAAVLGALVELLQKIGLPTRAEQLPATGKLMDAMLSDKKVAGGKVRLVLPDRLGAVSIVNDAPREAIVAAWDSLRL